MAKQPTTGRFKENTATSASTEGAVTFADLLQDVAGTDGMPTASQLRGALKDQGYAKRDINRAMRAFNRIGNNAGDYILRDEGYDVKQDGQIQTQSGRRRGNRAGFDAGDLIGLGGDVSTLAGIMRNQNNANVEAKQERERAEAEANAEELTLDDILGEDFDEQLATDVNAVVDANLDASGSQESGTGSRGTGSRGTGGSGGKGTKGGGPGDPETEDPETEDPESEDPGYSGSDYQLALESGWFGQGEDVNGNVIFGITSPETGNLYKIDESGEPIISQRSADKDEILYADRDLFPYGADPDTGDHTLDPFREQETGAGAIGEFMREHPTLAKIAEYGTNVLSPVTALLRRNEDINQALPEEWNWMTDQQKRDWMEYQAPAFRIPLVGADVSASELSGGLRTAGYAASTYSPTVGAGIMSIAEGTNLGSKYFSGNEVTGGDVALSAGQIALARGLRPGYKAITNPRATLSNVQNAIRNMRGIRGRFGGKPNVPMSTVNRITPTRQVNMKPPTTSGQMQTGTSGGVRGASRTPIGNKPITSNAGTNRGNVQTRTTSASGRNVPSGQTANPIQTPPQYRPSAPAVTRSRATPGGGRFRPARQPLTGTRREYGGLLQYGRGGQLPKPLTIRDLWE